MAKNSFKAGATVEATFGEHGKVAFDGCLFLPVSGANFGGLINDVANDSFEVGATVEATFWSACPRNNVRLGSTFLTVERQNRSATGGWEVVRFISL
jgi:hypothetical protein